MCNLGKLLLHSGNNRRHTGGEAYRPAIPHGGVVTGVLSVNMRGERRQAGIEVSSRFIWSGEEPYNPSVRELPHYPYTVLQNQLATCELQGISE